MKQNVTAYMILIDMGAQIVKGIAYGTDLQKDMNDPNVLALDVSFFRGLQTNGQQMGYYDIFLFTSEENQSIQKNRVIGVAPLSTTHAVAFMDYLNRTTNFAKAKELPYFENNHLFEPKN